MADLTTTLEPLDTAQIISAVFDELAMRQLAFFARHTPTQRLTMMFDLCEFSRRVLIASERQRNPTFTEDEILGRVRLRIQLAYGS